MSEEVIATQEPVIISQSQPASSEPVAVKKEEDIITRASKFIETTKVNAPTEPVDFDSKELERVIEGIQDPVAKEMLIKKSKSLESGFGKKFQELAELRKKLENISAQSQQWTPERVQSLLQDPMFVQAAQAVASSQASQHGMTEEEYSQLTDGEKAQLAKLPQLEQELSVLKNERFVAQKNEQDARLKEKYHNYDPKVIDTLTSDLIAGKITATREDLWKVRDYDDAVQRAYKMGLADRENQNKERLEAVSHSGSNVVPNSNIPKREAGQSNKAHFLELARRRLEESKQMAGAKK